MSEFNQRKYINNWIKENMRCYRFNLNNVKDKELIEFLDNMKNRTEYIRNLIKEDMNKNK